MSFDTLRKIDEWWVLPMTPQTHVSVHDNRFPEYDELTWIIKLFSFFLGISIKIVKILGTLFYLTLFLYPIQIKCEKKSIYKTFLYALLINILKYILYLPTYNSCLVFH